MSTPKRLPWLKWYPGDWRAEPRLKMVSRAARSLWVDMLGLMHEAEPYGFLIVARTPLTTAPRIAKALGDTEKEISPLLADLEAAGVFSRVGAADLPGDIAEMIPASIPAATILSRKMVRDEAKRTKNRENGGKGGNPNLRSPGEYTPQELRDPEAVLTVAKQSQSDAPESESVKPSDNPPVNPMDNRADNHGVNPTDNGGVKAQRLETRDQKKENAADAARHEGSETDALSAPVIPFRANGANGISGPPLDADRQWLFDHGLPWLAKRAGRPEASMRSLIGRWLKELKDDATALRRVIGESGNMIEPIGWITKAVEARAKAAAPFEQTDDYGWHNRLTSFRANGAWPEKWGGKFPGDHPAHPAELLVEFGFTKSVGGSTGIHAATGV